MCLSGHRGPLAFKTTPVYNSRDEKGLVNRGQVNISKPSNPLQPASGPICSVLIKPVPLVVDENTDVLISYEIEPATNSVLVDCGNLAQIRVQKGTEESRKLAATTLAKVEVISTQFGYGEKEFTQKQREQKHGRIFGNKVVCVSRCRDIGRLQLNLVTRSGCTRTRERTGRLEYVVLYVNIYTRLDLVRL